MMNFQAVRRIVLTFLGALLANSACFTGAALAQAAYDQQADYLITGPEGTVIGWQKETVTSRGDTVEIHRAREMRFTVDGHDPVSTYVLVTRSIDQTGKPRFLVITSLINEKSRELSILFKGGIGSITHTHDGTVSKWEVPYPDGKPLKDLDALLGPAMGEFAVFNLSTLTFEVMQNRNVAAGDAGKRADIRSIDGLPAEIWLREYDDDGDIAASIRPLLGSPIRFERLSEGEALPKLSGSGQINHQLVPASYTISGRAKSGKIRYNFGLLEALVPLVPQTSEQSVTAMVNGLRMDICEDCGPGLASDEATLRRYTQPTAWLQSDESVFKKRGERMARRSLSDAQKMRLLGGIARGRLSRVDLNGHSSAYDAWRNRAGDCTEDAVVLAALARASGIPAIVASGIVYTRERYHGAANAFVPHSWVIAYVDGEWKSFDYTLEDGFDSTHIAFTIGEGDARSIAAATQIAAMLEWEDMAEIRRRPNP